MGPVRKQAAMNKKSLHFQQKLFLNIHKHIVESSFNTYEFADRV
jgi:hypothetical protein